MSMSPSGTPEYPSPWWRNAVIYQIYPRSFADGNGDGTGDLAGVRAHLAYLRDLGVDAVWFTPWYLSPLGDGGYDVADYRVIDPTFGAIEEAETLIAEAATRGLRTIVDIVPNHVSDQHNWFRAALKAGPGSPERARFWFHRGKGEDGSQIPTRWVSSFQGSTWTRTTNPDGTPGEWYLHLFTPEQPDLNWNHLDVRREHEAIVRFWFDRGVAGIRIDSAALLIKDPALPEVPADLPPGGHPFTDRDELHDVYRTWRAIADSYEEQRVLVGEIWLPDAQRFADYLRPDGTTAEPWLPQPDWWGGYAVDAQAVDPASMLSLYRAAITTRRSEPGLRDAPFAWLENSGAGSHVLAFTRGDIACLVNFGAEPASLPQHSTVLLASGDLPGGQLPTDTAVWLRL